MYFEPLSAVQDAVTTGADVDRQDKGGSRRASTAMKS
jgi:hypothetical protein